MKAILNENKITSRAGKKLSRRAVLKTAAAAFGLPALEAFTPLKAFAQSAVDNFVVFYLNNGRYPGHWVPQEENGTLRFPSQASSLDQYADRMLFCKDMNNSAGTKSPGASHAMGTGTMLTSRFVPGTWHKTLDNSISVDQAIAESIGGDSSFRSLQWSSASVNGTPCDVGQSACAHTHVVSWAGPNQPLDPIRRENAAFNQLFSNGGSNETISSARKGHLKSVLDMVFSRGQVINQGLSASDRARLDQYFTGIREVEMRMQASVLECQTGNAPVNSEDFETRVDNFIDLITLALACGQTKVITYMIDNGLSSRNYGFIGAAGGHHDISHYNNNNSLDKLAIIERWQNEKLASLVGKMIDMPGRQGGSLLDETLLIGFPDMGEPNWHTHSRTCPLLIGGRNFDTTGKMVNFEGSIRLPPGNADEDNADGEDMAHLHVTFLESYGITKRFGQDGKRFGNEGDKVLNSLLRS